MAILWGRPDVSVCPHRDANYYFGCGRPVEMAFDNLRLDILMFGGLEGRKEMSHLSWEVLGSFERKDAIFHSGPWSFQLFWGRSVEIEDFSSQSLVLARWIALQPVISCWRSEFIVWKFGWDVKRTVSFHGYYFVNGRSECSGNLIILKKHGH